MTTTTRDTERGTKGATQMEIMSIKYEGDLWTSAECHRISRGMENAPAVPVRWIFNKFYRTDNGDIRYTIKHPDWAANVVCDSFDDLMRVIEGGIAEGEPEDDGSDWMTFMETNGR